MRTIPIVAAILLLAAALQAALPSTMSYQGVLNDNGAPVPDDDYSMSFAIYNVESGGAALWTESRSVEVSGGVFNVILGEVTPIDLDFDVPYWLEISVEGEAPMSPRTELTSAPYSFRAAVADSLAGGAPADSDWSMNGSIAYRTNDVGIGTATPMSKLTISSDDWDDHLTLSRLGNTPGHISIGTNQMILWSGSGSGLYIDQTGNIGVGVASPTAKLQIDGTTRMSGFQLPTGAVDGYVLTSDAGGVGTWQATGGGMGGSGTVDYIPKFTGATTLGDSPIRLNGTMVGIGTSPSATLHVNGTLDVEDETIFHSDVYSTNVQSDGDLTLAAGSLNRVHVEGSTGYVGVGTTVPEAELHVAGGALFEGSVGVGTTAPASKLTVSSPDYDDHITLARTYDDTAHITIGGGNMLMWMGGGSPLAVSASGSVGVGVTSPTAKLDVDGTAEVTGFRMPTDAAQGRLLVSDASGNGTWQTLSEGLTLPYSGEVASADAAFQVKNTGTGNAGTFWVQNASGTSAAVYGLSNSTAPAVEGYASGSANNAAEFVIGNPSNTGTAVVASTIGDGLAGEFYGDVLIDGVLTTAEIVGPTLISSPAETLLTLRSGSSDYDVRALVLETSATPGYRSSGISSSGFYTGGKFTGAQVGLDAHAEGDESDNYVYGVYANATGGERENVGVFGLGYAPGVGGTGVWGKGRGGESKTNNIGVFATCHMDSGYAGYFTGDVHVSCTLSKGMGSFKIDHPLYPETMYLSHSFVESPDMMNVYNGNVVLDGHGEAWVELPDYFEALNRDFRYQLTPIGGPGPNLYIAERMSENRFKIAGGEPRLEVSWQVTGIRHDKLADARRIVVEEQKELENEGKYLNPEVYGQRATDAIGYKSPPVRTGR